MSILDDLIKGTPFEKESLRSKRKPILEAFDKYKANVEYGIEAEDEQQHEDIVLWYRKLLDLNNIQEAINALNNIPERIKYYL